MRLHNPTESLGNVEKSEKYRTHGTKMRDLLNERSLAALRQVSGR
jgi:hypothetical protein